METTPTYGYRINRMWQVYAFTSPAKRGRPPAGANQLHVGDLLSIGRRWRNDQTCDTYATQDEAAQALIRLICG